MRSFKNRLKYGLVLFVLTLVMGAPHSFAAGLSIVRDAEIEATLREWGKPVFEAAKLNPDAVNIILVQNDAINAFVAGGSNIFFYTGLLRKTDNPGEVIGVMAHETGHITGGHLIKTREAMERASYESIVATILGIGAAIVSGDGGAATALSAGGSGIAQRKFLAHSRVQESSADQAALTFMEKSKMNPKGIGTFMNKLKSEELIPESQQSEYVRTHPLVGNRVEILERRIDKSPYKSDVFPPRWMTQHARMIAKLNGFIHPENIQWIYDDSDTSIEAQYARAIAAYRTSQIDKALLLIKDLLEKEPQNPYFHELMGQVLVDFGRVDAALPYYEQAVGLTTHSALIRIAYAHALLESGKGKQEDVLNEAVAHLLRAQHQERRSSRVHRLLAIAYGRLKQEDRAKLHLAEEAVLQRRYDDAVRHANGVLQDAEKGSSVWLQATDIISFVETTKKE